MGSVIGGIIGGVGSIIGANQQARAAERASQAALTGYNYLTRGPGGQAVNQYIGAGTDALAGQQNTQNMQAQLLGAAPIEQGTQNAFNRYKDSTGYQFQLNEGSNAITGNAASRGLLQSGATAKALTQYGQGIAGQTFNNYLAQLGGLNSQQGATAQMGQNALGQVASAGAAGGGGAANAIIQGGNAQAAGIAGAAANFGSAISNGVNFFNQPRQNTPTSYYQNNAGPW